MEDSYQTHIRHLIANKGGKHTLEKSQYLQQMGLDKLYAHRWNNGIRMVLPACAKIRSNCTKGGFSLNLVTLTLLGENRQHITRYRHKIELLNRIPFTPELGPVDDMWNLLKVKNCSKAMETIY